MSGVWFNPQTWEWDFIFSDGSKTDKTVPLKPDVMWIKNPTQVKTVRILFNVTSTYSSALIGLEMWDHSNALCLQTPKPREYSQDPNTSDLAIKQLDLEPYERIIGVRSGSRGTKCHYDL